MKLRIISFMILLFAMSPLMAQQISKEELIFLTPDWTGERFSDGRPSY